ncbi:UNVERIFIED_CONTAM: multiple sugar transport system substrate-binding protein [Acetivibrio alkalicellulosi]
MKKYILFLIYSTMLLLIACNYGEKREPIVIRPGHGVEMPEQNNILEDYSEIKKIEELTIWSFYEISEEIKELIHKGISNSIINYRVISPFEATNVYSLAHSMGELPDVFILDPILMGSFNSTNAFIDLNTFNAESIINEYPENLKKALRSLDGKKLIALPVELFPAVTFYRYDAMKAAGFPADPEELAVYMENINNWLQMAKTFRENDKYMISWTYEPLFYADISSNVFDSNLNFMRNTNLFVNMLELGRTVDSLGLAHMVNLTDFNKESSIETGKTIMFQSTFSDIDTLKKLTNGKEDGKWRMTRLPFGIYSWANSAVAAISSEASNKEAAWTVVELLSNRHIEIIGEVMKPNDTNVYNDVLFGDQDIDRLYRMLIERIPDYNLTPLDEKARTIWWSEVFKDSSNISVPAATLLNNCSQTVLDQLDKDIEALKPYMKSK